MSQIALVAAANRKAIAGILYANVQSVLPACPLALAGPIPSFAYPSTTNNLDGYVKWAPIFASHVETRFWLAFRTGPTKVRGAASRVGECKSGNERTRIALGQRPVCP